MSHPVNRRGLLKWGTAIGAAAVLPRVTPVSANTGKVSSNAFAITNSITPMNAANLTPLLLPIAEKVTEYARLLNQDVSFINRRNMVSDKVALSRDKVATMLGIDDPQDLAFVRNTSEANSVINNGLDLGRGDEVLIWNQNHPTNYQSWRYRQLRRGFAIREVLLPEEVTSNQQIIDAFVSRLNPKTRVVTFSELSNISGLRMPAKALCSAVHDYNPDILVHVDGAQSWGCLDLKLSDMGCDSFSSSAHKWFMGPRGTGILYVNKKWASRIWPNTLGYDFLMDYPLEELPETARRFECIGQRDVAPYAAIGHCVDLYNQLGGSKFVEQRIQSLSQYALNAFDTAGIKVKTPRMTDKGHPLGHGVIIADLGSSLSVYGAFLALHNQGIASAFVSGSKVCCETRAQPPSDDLPTYLRLSPHIYNSERDIDRAVATLRRIQNSNFEIVKEVVRFL
ncbi:aminotransferase class V-fold PLP-dependent enzyme [Pseudomaricurvus alkylphenolicus]|uniref:aminotransferase class V-fold PLP-dependent enzyme n=1 Tax=Pseudomaricurvus alkylphenolicus TaxID=1306991 RepID=UPI0014203623|nr:aminotransferase class V-fold PLP-dependent enzyme [Pseudomaricurvus alkylphenolicus]NIB42558.1 aminotransferase class V-fold PLP-dependent enzyme [Pseudomaricurvus alkylphenolicus]